MMIKNVFEQHEDTNKNLFDYGNDMVQQAIEGKLSPTIGRDKEIDLVIEILSRKIKSNVLLVGDSGVGKTAIVEGIAQRIAKNNIPDFLKGCTIFSLDYSSLVSNSFLRGQFENKVRFIINKIIESKGKIILFIDEIHNIIATQKMDVGIDMANMLKPILARSDVRVIGATTWNEYHLYIERDSAFTRRTQLVTIDEPSIDETVKILLSMVPDLEKHHNVHIKLDIIEKIVKMSKKYLDPSTLPDKAIDILDISCSKNKIKRENFLSGNTERSLQQKISDSELAYCKDCIKENIEDIMSEYSYVKQNSPNIINLFQQLNELKQEEEQIKQDIEKAKNDFDFNQLTMLQNISEPKIKQSLEDCRNNIYSFTKGRITDIVTINDVSNVISDLVGGISSHVISSIWSKDVANIKNNLEVLESKLQKRTYNQITPESAKDIVNSLYFNILSSSINLSNTRPLASFIFVGSEYGKEKIATLLSKFFYKDDDSAIAHVAIFEDGKIEISEPALEHQAKIIMVKIFTPSLFSEAELYSLIKKANEFISREITFISLSVIIFSIESSHSGDMPMIQKTDNANKKYLLKLVDSIIYFQPANTEVRINIASDRINKIIKNICIIFPQIDFFVTNDSVLNYFALESDVKKMLLNIDLSNKEILKAVDDLIRREKDAKKVMLAYDDFNKLQILEIEIEEDTKTIKLKKNNIDDSLPSL